MRRFLVLGLLLLAACGPKKTVVSWSFKGIEEGYDHDNRTVVYVDGTMLGKSSIKPESQPNSMKVAMPPGNHAYRIVNLAFYRGEWEEHLIDNEYSVDCEWESSYEEVPPSVVELTFDLDSGTTAEIR